MAALKLSLFFLVLLQAICFLPHGAHCGTILLLLLSLSHSHAHIVNRFGILIYESSHYSVAYTSGKLTFSGDITTDATLSLHRQSSTAYLYSYIWIITLLHITFWLLVLQICMLKISGTFHARKFSMHTDL